MPPPAAPPARPTLNLPVISFRIVDDGRNLTNGKKDNRRDGVFSETSRGYGCESKTEPGELTLHRLAPAARRALALPIHPSRRHG